MRCVKPLIIFAGLGLVGLGCAQHAPRAVTPTNPEHDSEAVLAAYCQPAGPPAAALAFTPPVLQDAPPLELSRDLRRPAAFVGYPESVAEFFYVRWDDRQTGGNWQGSGSSGGSGSLDRYERRAVSEKSGVLFR